MIVLAGATSISIDVQIVDDSGLVVTGLNATSFPAVTYSLAGANADAGISLSDLAALTSSWSSGGLKERGGGVYRLDLPNAAFVAAGEVKVRGEASGKHLLAPWIDVGIPVIAGGYATGQDPGSLVMAASATGPSGSAGAALSRIGSAQVTIRALIDQNGNVTLIQGCDYLAIDDRALDFTDTSNLWPDLTASTVTITLYTPVTGTFTGSVVTPSGTFKKVRWEPTHLQTVAMPIGNFLFRITATLSSAHVIELYTGQTIVRQA